MTHPHYNVTTHFLCVGGATAQSMTFSSAIPPDLCLGDFARPMEGHGKVKGYIHRGTSTSLTWHQHCSIIMDCSPVTFGRATSHFTCIPDRLQRAFLGHAPYQLILVLTRFIKVPPYCDRIWGDLRINGFSLHVSICDSYCFVNFKHIVAKL